MDAAQLFSPNRMMLFLQAAMWMVPVLFAAAAVLAAWRQGQRPAGTRDDRFAWAVAQLCTVAAILVGAGAVLAGTLERVWNAAPRAGVVDMPGAVMLMLVAFLGWIIVRFSCRYLDGEPGRQHYLVMLLATLTAVAVLVVSRHLGMLLLAWVLGSIALHRLLVFYPERRAAQIAAHKKFLVSRLAEIAFAGALLLIWRATGTLSIDTLAETVRHSGAASPALQWAAVLIALTVILKSAQLPLHGWLIQVMEAPTPVSALLHAGVVNIGGFVLIRLAFLIEAAPAARALLVLAGTLTAMLAGLVMMTRISIKVRLAWSTCAQMGYLLLECGLGLWELALLHLVAHSLYKAHAFLSAGETARDAMRSALMADRMGYAGLPQPGVGTRLQWLLALPMSAAIVLAVAYSAERVTGLPGVPGVVVALLAVGLAPLLWPAGAHRSGMTGARADGLGAGSLRVLLVAVLTMLWHALFAAALRTGSLPAIPLSLMAIVGLLALYFLQGWTQAFPADALSRRLYRSAYGGFALDEAFTRLAFRIWPVPPLPPLYPLPHGERP